MQKFVRMQRVLMIFTVKEVKPRFFLSLGAEEGGAGLPAHLLGGPRGADDLAVSRAGLWLGG